MNTNCNCRCHNICPDNIGWCYGEKNCRENHLEKSPEKEVGVQHTCPIKNCPCVVDIKTGFCCSKALHQCNHPKIKDKCQACNGDGVWHQEDTVEHPKPTPDPIKECECDKFHTGYFDSVCPCKCHEKKHPTPSLPKIEQIKQEDVDKIMDTLDASSIPVVLTKIISLIGEKQNEIVDRLNVITKEISNLNDLFGDGKIVELENNKPL